MATNCYNIYLFATAAFLLKLDLFFSDLSMILTLTHRTQRFNATLTP